MRARFHEHIFAERRDPHLSPIDSDHRTGLARDDAERGHLPARGIEVTELRPATLPISRRRDFEDDPTHVGGGDPWVTLLPDREHDAERTREAHKHAWREIRAATPEIVTARRLAAELQA